MTRWTNDIQAPVQNLQTVNTFLKHVSKQRDWLTVNDRKLDDNRVNEVLQNTTSATLPNARTEAFQNM